MEKSCHQRAGKEWYPTPQGILFDCREPDGRISKDIVLIGEKLLGKD